MTEGIRVLFIAHVASTYGASRSLLQLLESLKSKGVEPLVCLPGNGPLTRELEERGIPFAVGPIKFWISYPQEPLKTLARLIFSILSGVWVTIVALRFRPHIIYTNSSVTPAGAIAAVLSRRPHIWHIREFGVDDYGFRYTLGFAGTARLIGTLSKQVIVISRELEKRYRPHVNSDRLTVINNPITVRHDQLTRSPGELLTSGAVRVGIVGLINPGKGQDEAIRAVSLLVKKGLDVYLDIAGDGEPRDIQYLKNLSDDLRIADRVTFLGFVDNPESVWNMVDIVLVCSRAEAFGRVTVEAMMAGRPVVAANSGATPEIVQDQVTGLLYQPGNPEDLAEKVLTLIQNPDFARTIALSAQQYAHDAYSPESSGQSVLGILQRIRGSSV